MGSAFSLAIGAQATTGVLYEAREPAATLVLAHGAGAGQAHPFMVRYATAIAERGVDVVTFDFVYMAAKKKAPDRMPALEACYRAVIAWARARGPRRLAIGGKSMGGRVASMVAAAGDPVDALVFLGYPLHPPGQPEKLRAAHLPAITAPMLFVQGERDSFGTPAELAPILGGLARATLLAIPSGDHSLSVPKKVRAQAQVDAEVQERVAAFVRG